MQDHSLLHSKFDAEITARQLIAKVHILLLNVMVRNENLSHWLVYGHREYGAERPQPFLTSPNSAVETTRPVNSTLHLSDG